MTEETGEPKSDASTSAQPAWPRPAYAWFVVGVLMFAYTVSFIDRQIVSLLVEPIKRDLMLSDTEISLLQGLAFAIFYTVMGIPIGWLADRFSRRGIISVGIFVWSLMTGFCGLARSYGTLFLARMGVGVGEAALSPAAYSTISDYFPPERLSTAISVYGMGIYVGSGLAFLVGGWVIQLVSATGETVLPLVGAVRNWQVVFLTISLLGIPALLLMLTVKEPARRHGNAGKSAPETFDADEGGKATPGFAVQVAQVLAFIARGWKTYVTHFLGFGLIALLGYGYFAWIAEFFRRTFGMAVAETAQIYGWVVMLFGTGGIVCGGLLADHFRRKGRIDGPIRAGMWGAVALTPFAIAGPLMPNATLAMIFAAGSTFFAAFPFGIAPAALQMITPNHMRAQVSAVYLFVINLIGLALGPSSIALFTDYVYGDESKLNFSMATVSAIAAPLSAVILFVCLKHFRASMKGAHEG